MCGIVGAFDLRGCRLFDETLLAKMAASVRHRGPDDLYGWSAPGIAMATRRLAIMDVANGRQPLADPTGRVHVSVNGELFNHRELRDELGSRGHRFTTRCDTEVWPALYLEQRERAFERARGQFAIAIWDARERTLLLGRDRVGICPLHVAVADGFLLWASEVKAILATGLVPRAANVASIDRMFCFFAMGAKETCFRGIESVRPGHYLRARGGDVAEVRYWDLSFPGRGEERTDRPERLVDEMTATLERAVARRLVSDGPVGSYLSGGLDSTLLLALAARKAPAPPTAFTVGFESASLDERGRSRRSASLLGSRLVELVPSEAEIAAALPRAVEAAEGPIMDTADACVGLLAERVAREGYKVVLTGEGADEGMAGYFWHKSGRVLGWLSRLHPSVPALVRAAIDRLATPATPGASLGRRFGASRPSLLDMYEPLARARSLLFADALLERLHDADPFSDVDLENPDLPRWDPLNQALYLEYKLMLPGHLLLGKGDRASMRSGVECRYPFLDEDFVALACSISPAFKLRGLTDKYLLREAARRVLPPAIARPPKTMFKAPPLALLAPFPRWAEELVSPESLEITGYFSPGRVAKERAIQRRLPAFAPRRFVVDGSYTAMVMTQLWHHLFLGGGLCSLPVWSAPAPEMVPMERSVEASPA